MLLFSAMKKVSSGKNILIFLAKKSNKKVSKKP